MLPSDGAASDAAAASTLQLTEGQRERIERNRAMALQRRQAAASSPPTPDVQHISQSPTVTPASKEGKVSAGHKKSRLVLDDSDCGQKKARLTMDDGRLNIYECLDVPKSSAETVADDERAGVYVLELNSGAIYVGKSDDLQRRIQQHRSNGPRAAAWVKEQGGVRKCLAPRVPPTDDLNDWERKETLVRMMIHGPEKVRAGSLLSQAP